LVEERSDVVIPRRREHESRGRVHDRLELPEKLRRNASQGCVAIVAGRVTTSVNRERIWEVNEQTR